MLVLGAADAFSVFERLVLLNHEQGLGHALVWHPLTQSTQKALMQHVIKSGEHSPMLAIIKDVPHLVYYTPDNAELGKVALSWQALTRRIVHAGRKSELILQACKLSAGMTAIDGTAGFGHDALILASTGAQVTLVEKNPVMALLLFYEHWRMHANPNWQKILARMRIVCADIGLYQGCADLVYLDPMFPYDSYNAKVGKHMQLLHGWVNPPTPDEEVQLFSSALHQLNAAGRLVVKRPKGAPNFAAQAPSMCVYNEALRFDCYQKTAK